jgi:general nucleoside transport system permease protein
VKKKILYGLAAPVLATVISLAVGAVALLLSGNSPREAYQAMWQYVDSLDSLVNILNRTGWYYVAGVAVAIGFKMNLFNIGVDGQYRLAALCAAALGAELTGIPGWLAIVIIMITAMAVGGAYAAIPGLLKVKRGVNEVVSTIMLNSIATGLTALLLARYFRDPTVDLVRTTKPLPVDAWLPTIHVGGADNAGGAELQVWILFAMAVGVGFYVLVQRMRFGYDLRMSGLNPFAARSSGVNPDGMVLKTIILSGVVAGLVGMGPLLNEFHRFADQFPTTLGFTGISVALLGRNNPVGIAIGAFVFAFIERASQILNTIGVPQSIGRILQGTILIVAVISFEVVKRYAAAATVREAAAKANTGPSLPAVGAAA